MRRNRIIFDVVVLIVYLLAANPVLTGIPLHEFVGIGAFVVMSVHVIVSANGLSGRGSVWRLVLNVLLILSLATCVVSGVMVSGTVLPSLGLFATGYFFWDPLHALSAKVLLAVLIVHVSLRVPGVIAWIRKRKSKTNGSDAPRVSTTPASSSVPE